jgi:ferritin
MLSEQMQKSLNEQVNAELFSSYLYLSMTAYFKSLNLDGFANWMYVQAQEELVHAMKFYDFINRRGGRAILDKVEAPKKEWTSPLNVFEEAFEHEKMITGRIHHLVDISLQERDHATNTFLQWFVTEQVEEEENADGVVRKLKLVGNAEGGLFMIDIELAKRVFTAPSAQQ